MTFLQPRFAREMVTALARVEDRAIGIVANDTRFTAEAIDGARIRQGSPLSAAMRRLRTSCRLAH